MYEMTSVSSSQGNQMVRPEPTYEQIFSVMKYSVCVANTLGDRLQCVEIPIVVLDIETGKEFAHEGKVQVGLTEEAILEIVLKRTSLKKTYRELKLLPVCGR